MFHRLSVWDSDLFKSLSSCKSQDFVIWHPPLIPNSYCLHNPGCTLHAAPCPSKSVGQRANFRPPVLLLKCLARPSSKERKSRAKSQQVWEWFFWFWRVWARCLSEWNWNLWHVFADILMYCVYCIQMNCASVFHRTCSWFDMTWYGGFEQLNYDWIKNLHDSFVFGRIGFCAWTLQMCLDLADDVKKINPTG